LSDKTKIDLIMNIEKLRIEKLNCNFSDFWKN